jgi:hypothetical protein
MAISTEGKIQIALALVFGIGAGAMMLFPEQKIIGAALIAFSIAGFCLLGWYHFFGIRRGRMTPMIGMAISGAVFATCLIWYLFPISPIAVDRSAEAANSSPFDPTQYSVLKRKYSKKEAEQLIAALDEIFDVADKQGLPVVTQTNDYGPGWKTSLANDGKLITAQKLAKISDGARIMIESIYKVIDKYPHFRTDLVYVINANAYPDPKYQIGQLIKEIEALTNISELDYVQFKLGDSHERFRTIIDNFINWVVDIENTRVPNAKRELSTFL